MTPTPHISAEQIAAAKAELEAIMAQVPVFTGMAERLKRAQDDLTSSDLDSMTALQSAVGALVYCQIAQFETGIKNMAQRADMLEKVLQQVEKGGLLVTPAMALPPRPLDGGKGGGRFGR